MCIVFIAIKQHAQYPLIIAANRDEFFARPTTPSHFWQTKPRILAGVDQQAGGTWMGINNQGHIAALTNIRSAYNLLPKALSRGRLVKDYLQSPHDRYHTQLQHTRDNFNGYNLLFGPWQNLQVYNNQLDQLTPLPPSFYGLSNASLNSPWPKLTSGRKLFADYCHGAQSIDDHALFSLLRNNTQADDAALPDTGVSAEWERRLSSIFVESSDYGTRSSTVLKIDNHHHVYWRERSYGSAAQFVSEQSFEFDII